MATMGRDVCATPPSVLAYDRQVIATDPSPSAAGSAVGGLRCRVDNGQLDRQIRSHAAQPGYQAPQTRMLDAASPPRAEPSAVSGGGRAGPLTRRKFSPTLSQLPCSLLLRAAPGP